MISVKRLVAGLLVAGALAVSGVQSFAQPRVTPGTCIRAAREAIAACYVNPQEGVTLEDCIRAAAAQLDACLESCK